jgi:hypothetical protein
MAITFRGAKGSPLTHTELDQNFRELYYSSSLLGSPSNPYGLVLHRSSSLDSGETIYLPTAVGEQYNIQIKSGSDNISSSFFTSSTNFTYNFATDHLSVSGSSNFSGNMTVLGTLTATQYETVLVSSSIQYASGSNQFGNSSDDNQIFTGSVKINGPVTTNNKVFATNFTGSSFTGSFSGSLLADNGVLSSSAQIATDISGSFTSTSASIGTNIATNLTSIGNLNNVTASFVTHPNTASFAITGSNTFVGNQIVSGALEATGVLTLPGIANVSASIEAATSGSGISSLVVDASPQLGGNLDLNSRNITGSGGINISGNIITTGSAHFSGSVTASGNMFIDGLISASGDIIAFASSDERLKDNVTPIGSAIDKINQIGGYEFDWNSDSEHSGHDVGVIAQEIEKVLPEVVAQRKNGYLAVRYEKIVALLIQAVKEQQLQIEELKSKL